MVMTATTGLNVNESSPAQAASRKGKVEQIVWDDGLDTMSREKKAADAIQVSFRNDFVIFLRSTFVIYRPKIAI
jgi:hypothetical protein